jgi:tetratricopeptide (TPR) repeat protein
MQYQWTEWDEDVTSTPDEEYQSLVRSLRRSAGFGLFFVRCTPVGGRELIKKIGVDVPQKQSAVLELSEPISNLIDLVKVFPDIDNVKILFIVGLEKSLVKYIRTGYGGQGDYYNLDTVPPILSHLNWQRENFRDRFPNICFVFLLPSFAIKYIIRRAPDFYDWGSGKIDISSSQELVAQESQRILGQNFDKYLEWTPQQRKERILEINELLLEPSQNQDQRASLLFEQGNIFAAGKEYEEAIAAYDRALQIKPDYHEAWNNRGIALGNLGRYEEAIVSYNRALVFRPDYHEAWFYRGIALIDLGRYKEALASCDRALKFKPDYYEVWCYQGIALDSLGRNEEAIALYDRALKFKPDYPQTWYNRGIALRRLRRYEEAIASYDKAIECKPDYHQARFSRSFLLGNLGKNEEAIASYDKTIESKPDYHQAWYNRGIALSNLGRYEEAIASYDKAVECKPDYHQAWYNRGIALSNLGRYEEAVYSYDKAIEYRSDYRQAWYNRGIALSNLGRYEEARDSYDKGIPDMVKPIQILTTSATIHAFKP